MDSDGLGLRLHFGRWYGVHVEFDGLSGTSIMASVVLRSGDLLRFPYHVSVPLGCLSVLMIRPLVS